MSSSQHGKSKTCQTDSISFQYWVTGPVNTKDEVKVVFFTSKIRDQEREMKNYKGAAKLLGKTVKRKLPMAH